MEVLRRPHRISMAPVRQPTGALMSEGEIHAFGIDMVASHMKENGYWVEWVNPDPTYMPQIRATSRAGKLVFVMVRTACYPETGLLPDDVVVSQHVLCSGESGGLSYFGGVSIACAAGATPKEWAIPVRDAGFHVKHMGIQLITPSGNGFKLGEPEGSRCDA